MHIPKVRIVSKWPNGLILVDKAIWTAYVNLVTIAH